MGTSTEPMRTFSSCSVDRPPPPEWISNSLGLGPKEIAVLEVNVQSLDLYKALMKYFAQRAVDIQDEAPAKVDRIHNNPLDEAREWPGTLSTVQCPPDRVQEFWRIWREPKNEESDDDDNPASRTYGLGYGWAKIKTDDAEVVFIQHYTRGEPQEERGRLGMFRVISLYGTNPGVLKKLCREATVWSALRDQHMTRARKNKYLLYTLKIDQCRGRVEWVCHGYRKSRPMSSIVLKEGLANEILQDVTAFQKRETKKWYLEHGLPYRRNFLFFGPPGCGKTSTIRSLAGIFKLKACFMSLTHKDMSDQGLVEASSEVPRPSILVFEDVDALFEDRVGKSKSNVTFSGILNAVDGMMSPDGVMMVMTTNHRNKLDAALTRCGRVDRQFEFAPPGHDEIGNYFLSYYPDAKQEDADRFADAVMTNKKENAKSIATLQQHFIHCRTDSSEEVIRKYCTMQHVTESPSSNSVEIENGNHSAS